MKKISIIIPHYNTPVLLRRLLESIPKNKEIEVVIVDDYSNKELGLFDSLRNLFNNYNMIKFIPNDLEKGAGNARNVGLRSSSGKWILFADSDDRFIDGFYESVSDYFDSNYEMVYFNVTSEYLPSLRIGQRHLTLNELNRQYRSNDLQSKVYLQTRMKGPVAKLIRRSFLEDNDIFFNNSKFGNDVVWNAKCVVNSKLIYVDNRVLYSISHRDGSLVTDKGVDAFRIRLEQSIMEYQIYRDNYGDQEMLLYNKTFWAQLIRSTKFGLKELIYTLKTLSGNKLPILNFSQVKDFVFHPLKYIKLIRREVLHK